MDEELGQFYSNEAGEAHYFTKRERRGPDVIFVSKETQFTNSISGETTSKRYIRKVLEKNEETEIVNVQGELVLRSSPGGREQIKVVVYGNDSRRMGFVIEKFRGDTGNPYKNTSFSFNQTEFERLQEFLRLVRFVDLSNTENFQTRISDLRRKVLVDRNEHELLETVMAALGKDRVRMLEVLRDANLSKNDIDVLSGRRDGLETFRRKLFDERDWTEKEWQSFFEKNTWIFGYGLDYRFLSILQREPAYSDSDLDGTNTVIGDFLLGSTEFTVLVELKRPDASLFERDKYRSRVWRLSRELQDSVSQILAQKAVWQIKSLSGAYTDSGARISQKTYDPKCILLLGSRKQFAGDDRDKDTKSATFELFRRDSRNIEILTYDELYERAYYLVNQTLPPD